MGGEQLLECIVQDSLTLLFVEEILHHLVYIKTLYIMGYLQSLPYHLGAGISSINGIVI